MQSLRSRIALPLALVAALGVGGFAHASAQPLAPLQLTDVLGHQLQLGAAHPSLPAVLIFMSRSAKDASSAFARTIDERLLDRAIESIGIVDVRRYGGILRRLATSYLVRSAEEAKVHRRERRQARGVDASPQAVDRWHLVGDFDGSLFARFGVAAEPKAPLAFVVDAAGDLHGPFHDVDTVIAALAPDAAPPTRPQSPRVLERLSRSVARHRRAVLAVAALLALAAFAAGRGLFARLGYAVFYDPAAESTRAAAAARELFGDGDPDVVALYALPAAVARARGVEDPAITASLRRAVARVERDAQVARVVGAVTWGGHRFVAADRRSTFVVVSLRGTPRDKLDALPRLGDALVLELPSGERLRPALGGVVPSGRSLTQLARTSLARGERLALPLTALFLVVVFGSVVAALLPVALGGLAILLALGALALLSRVVAVDAFAVNVVTILGLGVAIDYALFLVSRYREELAAGGHLVDATPAERERALARAVATAGRSVLFSGLTIAASLCGLLVFPQPFLRSVAVGGIAVVMLATALALVVLPALLGLLGARVERGRIGPLWRRAIAPPAAWWSWLAAAVIRRRLAVAVAVTCALVVLAAPFLRLRPSRSDVRALPATEEPRRVADALARDFPSLSLTPATLLVTMDGPLADEDRLAALFDYTTRLATLPSVDRVESVLFFAGVRDRDGAAALADRLAELERQPQSPRGRALASLVHGGSTLVRVIAHAPPDSPAGQTLVGALRSLPPPPGAHVRLFGQAAALHDFAAGLAARTPWMLAVVALAMLTVLSVAFRSAVLPWKAMLMTALSLTASFGAIVWVFQDGRFQSLLGYRALGTIDAALPVVLFAVVFGLSMDYEVLMLTRMRERWLRDRDNDAAIVDGVTKTARLVTSAAAIMVVVFSAFTAAPVVFVKALGFGMALAVALDATVVRLLLVPATMALLGRLNWWTPRPPTLSSWRGSRRAAAARRARW